MQLEDLERPLGPVLGRLGGGAVVGEGSALLQILLGIHLAERPHVEVHLPAQRRPLEIQGLGLALVRLVEAAVDGLLLDLGLRVRRGRRDRGLRCRGRPLGFAAGALLGLRRGERGERRRRGEREHDDSLANAQDSSSFDRYESIQFKPTHVNRYQRRRTSL